MTSEQVELDQDELECRIVWAITVRPSIDELVCYLHYLGNKQVTPQDRSAMEEADRLIAALHKHLEEATEDYFKEAGPLTVVDNPNPFPLYAYFRNAIRQLKKEIRYLRSDRPRQGNSDWRKWLREAHYLKRAHRDLTDFLTRIERSGFDPQAIAARHSRSESDGDGTDQATQDALRLSSGELMCERGSPSEGDRAGLEAQQEREWERACKVLNKRQTALAEALRASRFGMSYVEMSDVSEAFTREDVSADAAEMAVNRINKKWATLQPLSGWTIATVSAEGTKPVLRKAVWKKSGQ